MAAFSAGDRKAKEGAEAEAKMMEAKIEAMTKQMAEEREKAAASTGKRSEENVRRERAKATV
jgi:hypothetical protein